MIFISMVWGFDRHEPMLLPSIVDQTWPEIRAAPPGESELVMDLRRMSLNVPTAYAGRRFVNRPNKRWRFWYACGRSDREGRWILGWRNRASGSDLRSNAPRHLSRTGRAGYWSGREFVAGRGAKLLSVDGADEATCRYAKHILLLWKR